uniref:Rad60/SUMO-like domain-containing protein n=1 Tax=Mycena chlorophos TaxID=658473 RepID=A0ABQ0MAJ3_MYCCL|nr:predicted protein [Mycena chlorophos]
MASENRPRPRPRPKPKAPQPAAASSAPVVDDDAMFIRNKSRSSTTWQRFDAIDKAATKKIVRSDTEDESDSPRPKKQSKTNGKGKSLQATHAEMRRILSTEPESDKDDSDLEVTGYTPSKKKGKARRSRSRSLTPPPVIPDHQLRHIRQIAREALDKGSRSRSRSPTPPVDANASLDSIDYAPEIQKMLRNAARSSVEPAAQASKETIELKIRWKSHPKDPKAQSWKEAITWKIHRTDNFRNVIEEVADEAGILAANVVLSYNSTRVFPSASPVSLGLWVEAELEACDPTTWEYLRKNPTRATAPAPSRPAIIEEDGALVISDTDDSSIIAIDNDNDDQDEESDNDEPAEEEQGGGEADAGGDDDDNDDSFKLILRSQLTSKDISLNVRPTTKCGAIVKAFLKKAGLAENYPELMTGGGTSNSKGPRKSAGKGRGRKSAAAAPAKDPRLQIDGQKMDPEQPIGDEDLEDGDVVDVVGL